MAKKQKTIMLNAGLARKVDEYERTHGARYSRILTAALLKYILGGITGPGPLFLPGQDTCWMQLAVELQRDEITIDDVPSRLRELRRPRNAQ